MKKTLTKTKLSGSWKSQMISTNVKIAIASLKSPKSKGIGGGIASRALRSLKQSHSKMLKHNEHYWWKHEIIIVKYIIFKYFY